MSWFGLVGLVWWAGVACGFCAVATCDLLGRCKATDESRIEPPAPIWIVQASLWLVWIVQILLVVAALNIVLAHLLVLNGVGADTWLGHIQYVASGYVLAFINPFTQSFLLAIWAIM